MNRIPAGYKVVPDVSYHQKVNYKQISPFIDGAIVRVAFGTWLDPDFMRHYEGFMTEGKPVAAFQWFRPDQDVKAQIEVAKLALDKTKINLVISDQEQHGIYAGGLIIPPYYSGDRLSTLGLSHITGLDLHGFKMGTYSRATWISQWAKPILTWWFNYVQWLASWPFAKEAVICSWETLLNVWAPVKFSPYFTADWPEDKKRADIWQWSGDKFVLPGITNASGLPRSIDLNYVSEGILSQFLKPEVEPVPEIPPVMISDPRVEMIYNELGDLLNSMTSGKLEIDSRLLKDIHELTEIRKMIKPEG